MPPPRAARIPPPTPPPSSARAGISRRSSASTPDRVAIGSQASVAAALVAAALPEGAEVLFAEGDFSSIVLPFVHSGRGLRCGPRPWTPRRRGAPRHRARRVLARAVGDRRGGGCRGHLAAARAHGARTLCDATQAVGWLPVDAIRLRRPDLPRLQVALRAARGVVPHGLGASSPRDMPPLFAGWYAGGDPWSSCYGHEVELASDARGSTSRRRGRRSSAPSRRSSCSPRSTRRGAPRPRDGPGGRVPRAAGLAEPERAERDRDLGRPRRLRPRAPHRRRDHASGRAGRARVAFHVFNDEDDVDLRAGGARALTSAQPPAGRRALDGTPAATRGTPAPPRRRRSPARRGRVRRSRSSRARRRRGSRRPRRPGSSIRSLRPCVACAGSRTTPR